MLCSIGLCRFLREIVGVSVGMLCAWRIHCVSSGVGRRGFFSSVLLRQMLLFVLSKNNVLVIGDLIQSCWDMRGKSSDPLYLTSICMVNPVNILASLILLMS